MEHTEQNSVVLSTTGLILPTYITKLLPIEIFYPFFSPSSLIFSYSPTSPSLPLYIFILFLKRLEDLLAPLFFARKKLIFLYVKMLSFLLFCMKVTLHYVRPSEVLWVLTILGKICWK